MDGSFARVQALKCTRVHVWVATRKADVLHDVGSDSCFSRQIKNRCDAWQNLSRSSSMQSEDQSLHHVIGMISIKFEDADTSPLKRRSFEEKYMSVWLCLSLIIVYSGTYFLCFRSMLNGGSENSYHLKVVRSAGIKNLFSGDAMFVSTTENRNQTSFDAIELRESSAKKLPNLETNIAEFNTIAEVQEK